MNQAEKNPEADQVERLRRSLTDLLTATGGSGSLRFSAFDVRNCLTALYLVTSKRLGDRATLLSADAARGLQQFLGIDADQSPEAAAARIEAHYREHPIEPALARAIELLLREFVGAEAFKEASPGLARLLGTEVSRRPLQGGERPEGAIPAGPLARFNTTK
jgi:hypothetical protein